MLQDNAFRVARGIVPTPGFPRLTGDSLVLAVPS